MAQFVLKIEKLSHIISVRGSQGLRSPSAIMVPVSTQKAVCEQASGEDGKKIGDKRKLTSMKLKNFRRVCLQAKQEPGYNYA